MRFLTVAALLAFSGVAKAENLFCEGIVYFNGEQVAATRMVSLNSAELRASVQTRSGWANGAIEMDPDIYKGRLTTPQGEAFWINLNRFNGDLIVVPILEPGKSVTVDFNGTCKRAEPKF